LNKYDDRESDDTIIGLEKIVIKSFEHQNNIMMMSPEILVEDNSTINLTNKTPARIRKSSTSMEYPGLDGLSGYDLLIVSKNFNPENNNYIFLSEGSPGGIGNPNGLQGKPGILNKHHNVTISRYTQFAYCAMSEYKKSQNSIRKFFAVL
jgi:hypothetical protein